MKTPVFNQKNDRLFSLDLLKAISIAAVVSFHSIVVPTTTFASSQLPLEILFSPFRFCVPVFLTISFFLFERGLAKDTGSTWLAIKKRLFRLFIPTLFWFTIAALLKLFSGNSWSKLIGDILQGEIFTGAYYLLILIQFIPVFIMLRGWFSKLQNFQLTILLQGLIFGFIYALPSIPEHNLILSILKTIDRPLFVYWFVYMALGVYFYKYWSSIVKLSTQIPISIKSLLLILYCIVQIFEYKFCFLKFGGEIPPFDYVMFSCILSVFILFLCFASVKEEDLSLPVGQIIKLFSKYSLGIFCINGILTQVFLSFGSKLFIQATFSFSEILMMKIIGWLLLLTISLMTSILIARTGLKNVVC